MKRAGLFTALAFAAAASAACRDQNREAPAEPLEAIAPLPDRSAERTDEKPGFIAALTPKDSADITAPYTSASATILVKLGDVVAKGQVLARLDDRVLRQELEAGKAQLKTARASIKVTRFVSLPNASSGVFSTIRSAFFAASFFRAFSTPSFVSSANPTTICSFFFAAPRPARMSGLGTSLISSEPPSRLIFCGDGRAGR